MTMLPKIVVKKGHMITKATITKIIKEARKKYLEWPFISIFSITELIRVILFINIVKGLIALTSELRKMTKKIFINAKNTKRQMDVAILYSGGKDSTLAIEYAISKNWNIKYLISVKPTRTDCYLYHFATVELTKKMAEILNIKHFYTTCSDADPENKFRFKLDSNDLGYFKITPPNYHCLDDVVETAILPIYSSEPICYSHATNIGPPKASFTG